MDFPTIYDNEHKIWHSPTHEKKFYDENCSVGRIAHFMMRSKPADLMCQISDSENTRLTFGEAVNYAIRVAQHLKAMGLTQDDVIGLVAPNTTLLMPVAIGCLMNCTPFHAINPTLEKHVLQHIFDISKPKLIFCDGLDYEKVKNASVELNEVKIITICNHLKQVPNVDDLLTPTATEYFYQPESLQYGPDQTVLITCSSGTTGLPKGVCVSNASMASIFGFFTGSTVMFTFAPPDWITGLMSLLSNALIGGVRIITSKPFEPERMIDIIHKYKVTFLGSSPFELALVSQEHKYTAENMQSVRFIFMTGGHCSPETLERIRAPLSGILMNGYGCTEFGGITGNFTSYKARSVGKLLPGIELKIIGEETKTPCGPNETGEVLVRKTQKWLGYYNNPTATQELMDAERWIHTGDLGYMDDEHYLYLVDRIKDVMKFRNWHFSPHEIEETVLQLPGVQDVCVFGVYDQILGDLAAAAVVRKPGSKLTKEEVLRFVEEQQEVDYKRLNYGVFFVENIARNSNGKILRKKMKELCLNMEKSSKL